MIVLDASITIAWCRRESAFPSIEGIFDRLPDTGAFAPHLWSLEVANGLEMAVRRGHISPSYRDDVFVLLRRLPTEIIPVRRDEDWGPAVALSHRHQLTVYDASYLSLAVEKHLPIATLDEELANAARAEGVEVLP